MDHLTPKEVKVFAKSAKLGKLAIYTMHNRFKLISLLTFLVAIFNSPAHAYAGPGAAIGAILVALTVIIAFFSSLIIKIFNLFTNTFKVLQKKLKSRKNLKKTIKTASKEKN